ncbi:Transcription initiation factor IIB (General transcription factor TFIIB), putative [Yarrowia lipolytica]|nr:Transcription initiation factor IIB (General transcription factor TFIIB), putative [Yarrowia lipolytica]
MSFQQNLNVTLMCPECKILPPDIVERFAEGDMVCGQCGLVLSDRVVDTRSEWRTFSNDDQGSDDPSRVGDAMNPLLEGSQLNTIISFGAPGSSVGRDLNRTQSRSLQDKKDAALSAVYAKISQICDGISLPRVVSDAAKEVYKLVHDDKRLRGKTPDAIIATVIFIACRHANVQRTFQEIGALTNVSKKEIRRTLELMKRLLEGTNIQAFRSTQTNPGALMPRYCSHLGLNSQVANLAEDIVKRAKEIGTLDGRSPISVAAAAIYMAAALYGNDMSAQRVSEKTGVSDGAIKTSYKHLYEAREKLVSKQLLDSGKVSFETLPKV